MLSVIIPTLNEAMTLPHTVAHTRRAAGSEELEWVVSDCGSRDGTAEVARESGLAVVTGAACRADALNRGAAVARGDVLLFLHADSLLPDRFPGLVRRALADPLVVGGAFDFAFGPHPLNRGWSRQCLKAVVLVNRVRFRWTSNFYGDQTIFVRREVFDRVGGFPPVRLMEDVRFSRRMKRAGRTAILRPPVHTSPRRFVTRGVVRQFLQDLTLLAFESCGGCPENLAARYSRWNHDGG